MWKHDLKTAWRNLRTQRSYALLNTLGLSVGIAGTLLIFLYGQYHLRFDRHHAQYDRLFRISTDLHLADGSVEYNPEAPLPMARVLREEYPQVEQAAFLMMNRDLTVGVRRAGESTPTRFLESGRTALTEPEWFQILSYTWLRGNPETALRAPNSVVLTETWARRYFGDENPIGQVLTLNNKTEATVTGLLADPPPTTDTEVGLFISLATLKSLYPDFDPNDWYYLNSTHRLYFTLKDPAAASSLQQALPALARKHYGADASVFQFVVQPMREFHFDVARGGGAIRSSLLVSLAAVGVLLIAAACINFINLATAQALGRSKEVGVRKSLGSSRGQLIRQFLLETTLVILVATALGTLLAGLALPVFNRWVALRLAFRPDGPTLTFVGLLLGVLVLLAGGYPAGVLSGFSPWAALRGKLSAASGRGFTVRKVLVVTQFGVCQVLILGALVVAQQVRYMQHADLGFQKGNVVVVPLPQGTKSAQEAFKQQLAQYTGVRAVSLSHHAPASELSYGGSFKFNEKPDWEPFPVRHRLADADYLSTYGLRLLAGRSIAPSDTIREYLINETLLRRLGFHDPEQVLGKKLQYYLSEVPLPIVGVVKDFHQKSLREEIGPCLIASRADWYRHAGIRISGHDPAVTLAHIRQTWQQLYPNDVFTYEFLDEQVARFYQTETLMARLTNAFTGLAILICCLGLYGLVSHVVFQRTKEIGIRKVLGASVAGVVVLLSQDFVKLVLVAIALATPVAWYLLQQWLQGFAYRIEVPWWILALAGTLSVGLAVLTISYQSIRAALLNPVKSLRSE